MSNKSGLEEQQSLEQHYREQETRLRELHEDCERKKQEGEKQNW